MSGTPEPPLAQEEVRVCSVDDIPQGLGRAFEVAGMQVAVFRSRSGAVYAMENRCPHRGGPMADGMLAGNRVVCPFHAFRYDLQTGQCDQANSCGLKVFPARVQDEGGVLVSLRPSV